MAHRRLLLAGRLVFVTIRAGAALRLLPSSAPTSPDPHLHCADVDMDVPKCGGECAGTYDKCDGKDFDAPLACCEPDYVCYVKNDDYSQCRPMGDSPLGWYGDVSDCEAGFYGGYGDMPGAYGGYDADAAADEAALDKQEADALADAEAAADAAAAAAADAAAAAAGGDGTPTDADALADEAARAAGGGGGALPHASLISCSIAPASAHHSFVLSSLRDSCMYLPDACVQFLTAAMALCLPFSDAGELTWASAEFCGLWRRFKRRKHGRNHWHRWSGCSHHGCRGGRLCQAQAEPGCCWLPSGILLLWFRISLRHPRTQLPPVLPGRYCLDALPHRFFLVRLTAAQGCTLSQLSDA